MSNITLKEAAKSALFAQSACNGQALISTLARFLPAIREHAAGGTDQINHHPVVVLFLTQLMHLAGLGIADLEVYSIAYRRCEELAADA